MKTIAAISTAQGQAGLGVIRISGDDAIRIANEIFEGVAGRRLTDMRGYTAAYGKIVQNGEAIDEAVVTVFRAPYSYTGENVVEISCHGGMYVTKRVLRAVLNAGAFPAEPGEFTKRAFLNSKMTLTQAESVMDIISAKGKSAAKMAMSLREGKLYKKIREIIDSLTSVAAHLSAWADYPEDDIPEVDSNNLLSSLESIKAKIENIVDNYDAGAIIREGVRVAIVGKPNVGKSTIMNLLAGADKSIVTEVAGTTRDVVEETVNIGDLTLLLSDTAGIRNTEDLVEQIGVKKAKDKIKESSLILAVFDSSRELNYDDKLLLNEIVDCAAVAVINKTDLASKIDVDYIKKFIENIVYISAKNEKGMENLEKEIKNVLKLNNIDENDGIISNERQYNAAVRALGGVNEAINSLKSGMTLDAVTVSLEGAIEGFLELTGERVKDTVVNQVFSRFCVGK